LSSSWYIQEGGGKGGRTFGGTALQVTDDLLELVGDVQLGRIEEEEDEVGTVGEPEGREGGRG